MSAEHSRTSGYRLRHTVSRGPGASATWQVRGLAVDNLLYFHRRSDGWVLWLCSDNPEPPLAWLPLHHYERSCGHYWWSWGCFPTRQSLLAALRFYEERAQQLPSPSVLSEALA